MKEDPSDDFGTALEFHRIGAGGATACDSTSCTNRAEIYNNLLLFATTYFESVTNSSKPVKVDFAPVGSFDRGTFLSVHKN